MGMKREEYLCFVGSWGIEKKKLPAGLAPNERLCPEVAAAADDFTPGFMLPQAGHWSTSPLLRIMQTSHSQLPGLGLNSSLSGCWALAVSSLLEAGFVFWPEDFSSLLGVFSVPDDRNLFHWFVSLHQ